VATGPPFSPAGSFSWVGLVISCFNLNLIIAETFSEFRKFILTQKNINEISKFVSK
jgi:hypothetical protein